MPSNDQAVNLIQKSSAVGIALPEKAGVDEYASYLALARVLSKLGKSAELIFSGEIPGALLAVLPKEAFPAAEHILSRELIIAVNQADSPIRELRYERRGDTLDIILTPKGQTIKKENVSFRYGEAKYDLLITLGAHSLEDMGRAFTESPDIFYEKPLLALDASAEHETFAEAGLVDAGRSSVSEITAEFVLGLSGEPVDEFSATALLLGIIDQTKNFQNHRTKPKTFFVAAELVGRGAKKDEISKALWKTKPLPLLQLWGRASVRSRLDSEKRILWSVLTKDDFTKTQTQPESAIPFVLEHIEEHFSLPENFVLLWQRLDDGMIQALVRTASYQPASEDLLPFGVHPNCGLFRTLFPTFAAAESAVLARLSKIRV